MKNIHKSTPPSFRRRENAAAIVKTPLLGINFKNGPTPDRGAVPNPAKRRRHAFSAVAFLAVLAVGLLFLLPGGLLQAQVNGDIMYAENGMEPVAIFAAEDPEGGMVFWSLAGDDANDFMIERGVLNFKSPPDFENPTSAVTTGEVDAQNTYNVTVRASDGGTDWSEEPVVVKVTNLNEMGMVTLSLRQPQSGITLVATLTDPDGGVTANDVEWQWAKSNTADGTFTDLPEPTTPDEYPVKDSDVGMFLRATAEYMDAEDEQDKRSVHEVSDNRTWAARTDVIPPMYDAAMAMRGVPENTAPGGLVGVPVAATDASPNDVLTYTLGGTQAVLFDIDPATGQIMVGARTMLNEETTPSYEVVVTATDASALTDTITVTITVTDVDEAPTVTGTTEFTVAENMDDLSPMVENYRYIKNDPEGYTTEWDLSGVDADDFEISDEGDLSFKDAPDYEDPMGGGANGDSNVYQVTIEASDGVNTGMLAVSVKVTDVDDAGKVALSQDRPEVGTMIAATLTDDDGGITGVTWQWHKLDSSDAASVNASNEIVDATKSEYKPVADDAEMYLHAVATYTDSKGPGKTATGVTENLVRADSANRPPMFVDADDEVVTTYERSVDEDVADRADPADVGDPVAASNNVDGSYELSGTDAASFMIDSSTGQISAPSETELDHEMKDTYRVMVTATAPSGMSSMVTVTINVTDVDEMPELKGDDSTDYQENGTGPVATYTARDPERVQVLWSLSGDDAELFSITGGVLRFKNPPDYGADNGADNQHVVTVRASDGGVDWSTKVVTVTVTDVDEEGTITLSSLQPQAGQPLTATPPTDPDGDASGAVTWEWAKARSARGTFVEIPNQTAASYTPVDDDEGYYLQATASYTDPSPVTANDEARAVSINPVRGAKTDNVAPEFPTGTAVRSVPENTAAGGLVGAPVAATDGDTDDVLTYTLGGTQAVLFDIDPATGQIMVGARTMLDEEDDDASYEVVVTATDTSTLTDTITVTITVTDVDEAPTVTGTTEFTVAENMDDLSPTVENYRYIKNDPEGYTTEWDLSGVDADDFEISDEGDLSFKDAPDYEDPMGGGANGDSNVYQVTIEASDGVNTGMLAVSVKVTDVDDAGKVALSQDRPEVGTMIAATLTDDDGGITGVTWQWHKLDSSDAASVNASNEIVDATKSEYKPVADDAEMYLHAVATYTDSKGPGKTATGVTENLVRADTVNRPPMFVDADDEVVTTYERSVDEDVADRADPADVGDPVTAKDVNIDDTRTYRLSGTDADSFMIVPLSGQINAPIGTKLNHEMKDTYTVIVTATDSSGASSSVTVTINVTDVDELPELERATSVVAITGTGSVDFPENDMGPVAMYTAAVPQAARAIWSVMGREASVFMISRDGVLTFRAPPDYENPTATDNIYRVTVVATSSSDSRQKDMKDVTVTVSNVEEAGTLTLSSSSPVVGTELTAILTDPDGMVTGEMWQWIRSMDMTTWDDIAGAMDNAYTPVEEDDGYYLQASVSYTDGHGSDKTAEKVSANAVEGGLAISGPDSPSYAENGMDAVGTYMVTGPDAASATWSLEGDDAGDFMFSGGMLTFSSSPNYEMPMDANRDNRYMVTIKATDGTYMDTRDVMVMVTNVEEPGRVTFWRDGADATAAAIMVGDMLGGAVDDSDGNPGDTFPIAMYTRIANVTSWQWAKTMTPDMMDSWMPIGTGGMYTVMDDDAGYYLRATAMYDDGEGMGKMASEKTMMVMMTTMNAAPMFDTETAERMVPENTAAGENVGAPVTAMDADNDTLTYSLGGTDMASFTVDNMGQIMVGAGTTLDYEGSQMTYMVTVTATDPSGATGTVDVMVMVTDVDEAQPADFDPLAEYDADNSGALEKDEVIQAINDYLFGVGADAISKEDVIETINLYLFG